MCSHLASQLSLQITKLMQKKATSAVPGRRLRKLDEANGQITHNETHFDEQTDNGLMTERTGHVHHGTKQDIVRQWLEGAEQAPSTGALLCFCKSWLSTYDIYIRYLHAISTCDIYMRYLHAISTCNGYRRYLHTIPTSDICIQ